MINNHKVTDSSTMRSGYNLTTESTTNKKTTITKKIKKKVPKDEISKITFSCYQDLCTRNITKNGDADRFIKSFITRTKIKDKSLENEKYIYCKYLLPFPDKDNSYYISDELSKIHETLAQLYLTIKNAIFEKRCENSFNNNQIEELIIDLISIKQEIIKIWNKYNPTTPYKYGYLQNNGHLRLEDEMLDFVQAQLFNCYYAINDDKNLELIINQLIEQNSIICNSILIIMFISDMSDRDNPDKLNFKNILTKFAELEKSQSKAEYAKTYNNRNRYNSNQLPITASFIKLFLEKTCIDSSIILEDIKLLDIFVDLVCCFTSYYNTIYNYTDNIKKISLGINFYFNNLDDPLFNGLHNTLLSVNSILFIGEFTDLIKKLKQITADKKEFTHLFSKIKKKPICEFTSETKNTIQDTEINTIQQKIKQLLIKYNIPTDNINSWYDIFIEESFTEIFFRPSNLIVTLAEWIDLSKKTEVKHQKDKKTQDNINSWLDTLVNEHKKITDEQISWNDIPYILLIVFYNQMVGESIRLTFGTPGIAKQEDIAILYAKIVQIFSPFLGTALLIISNKDSYDDLLTDLDMLEFISQQTDKTKYIKSSQYLIAQIITYLVSQNNKLDLVKKQLLITKAEKLYLELASSGINQAYLLLAETVASLAKIKMYEQNFLEAADLYYQASSYCKILSEVDNLEINLQDLALINMNCFSTEADVLRKIHENQTLLLQELTIAKTTTKTEKKSRKQTANITAKIDKKDLVKEMTIEEVVNWHQTYIATTSKPHSTKNTQAKKIEAITQLPSRNEIDNRRDFWLTIRELLASSINFATSYILLVKLTKNNYFNMLESKFKDGIMQNNSWVVLLVYQKMAYYHFFQLKYAHEIGGSGNNLKLFYVADSKTPAATKAKKITFKNISDETELLIYKAIKLICTDIPKIETKDLREIFLSLSPANYRDLLPNYKNQLASLTSTYGHLKSLDDNIQGYRGKSRLAAKLYDKADEINPNRLIRKQKKQTS